jgi:hypothetical protein
VKDSDAVVVDLRVRSRFPEEAVDQVEAVNRPDLDPICPHCQARVVQIWTKQVTSTLGKRYIYFCSSCSKVLGVSHRKGFWMG